MPTIIGASGIATTRQNRSLQQDLINKLTSGSNIPKATNAAALETISRAFQVNTVDLAQSTTTTTASADSAQRVSIGQAADRGLSRIFNNLVKLKELAAQTLSGKQNKESLVAINAEFVKIRNEISHIAETTTFNGHGLLNNNTDFDGISLNGLDATGLALGISELTIDTVTGGGPSISAIDSALDQISGYRVSLDYAIAGYEVAFDNVAGQIGNFVASNSDLANTDADINSDPTDTGTVTSSGPTATVNIGKLTNLVTSRILNEIPFSIQAQANKNPQALLKILEN